MGVPRCRRCCAQLPPNWCRSTSQAQEVLRVVSSQAQTCIPPLPPSLPPRPPAVFRAGQVLALLRLRRGFPTRGGALGGPTQTCGALGRVRRFRVGTWRTIGILPKVMVRAEPGTDCPWRNAFCICDFACVAVDKRHLSLISCLSVDFAGVPGPRWCFSGLRCC